MHNGRTELQVQWSEKIGQRITRVRKGRDWTRTQLARECRAAGYGWLTSEALLQIERDARTTGLRRSVTVDDVCAIASVMGVDPDVFFLPFENRTDMDRFFIDSKLFEAGWSAMTRAEEEQRVRDRESDT